MVRPFPLSWDQRNRVKLDAELVRPFDGQSSLIVLYNSARPYTYFPTRDGFTPLNPSKTFLPNNVHMKDVTPVYLKLLHRFPLDARRHDILQLDSRNARWMDSSGRVGGEPGDSSAYHNLRRTQIGTRMDF